MLIQDLPEAKQPARCDLTTGELCGAPLIRYIPHGQKLEQDYRCSRCGVYVSQFAADTKVGKEWSQFKAERDKRLEQARQKKEEDRLYLLEELVRAKAADLPIPDITPKQRQKTRNWRKKKHVRMPGGATLQKKLARRRLVVVKGR